MIFITMMSSAERHTLSLELDIPGAAPAHYAERVRRLVLKTLLSQERPSLTGTARGLKASRRTVQRRLLQEGTSYQMVLDAVRRDLAMRLIKLQRLSIVEIAYWLGFSDSSAFRRTFKRWTGLPPALERLLVAPLASAPAPS